MTICLHPPPIHAGKPSRNAVSGLSYAREGADQAALSTWAQYNVTVHQALRLFNQATSIGSLPPEILEQVFEFAKWSNAAPDHRPWMKPLPITISHVSGYWREVALNSSLLWTEIDISPPWSLKIMKLYLTRSKTCPIHVKLAIPSFASSNRLSLVDVNASAPLLCDAITEHIPRCRKITIRGDFNHFKPLLDAILNVIHGVRVSSLLEHLVMQVTSIPDFRVISGPDFQVNHYTPFSSQGAPALTRLRLTNLMVPCLPPLDHITSLHLALGDIHGIYVAEFTALATSCPLLETLAIYDDVVLGPWPITATIELPSLRSLQVYGTFMSVSDLLRVVSAPLLEDLVIAPVVGDDLLPFYHHTMASTPKYNNVKSFTLSPVSTSGFALLTAASVCFPAVEQLTIPNVHPDSFRDIFMGADAAVVLPNLNALALRDVDFNSMQTLLAVMSFRKAAGRPIQMLYLDRSSIDRVASMIPLLAQSVRVVERDIWSMLHDNEDSLDDASHYVGNNFDIVL